MIGIYARQSINKKDSISIELQIEKCTLIAENNYKIYQDKGFSGKNINRPAFKDLMYDVEKGIISKIIVYKLDRFSRSITDFCNIWEKLKQKNVEFISINENFDTSSPIGKAMLHILMIFAELERETIAERVKDNYYLRAKNGNWTGGPPPFGFSIKKEKYHNKNISVLAVNKKIDLVKYIFCEYSKDDTSLTSIVKNLNKENGIKWNNVSISRILHNPIYAKCNENIYIYYLTKNVNILNHSYEFNNELAGMLIKKNSSKSKEQIFSLASHKGVINPDIWLKCQYKLEKNKQIKNSGKGKYTWLSGLLKCGKCNYSIKIVMSKRKRYLVCSGHTNYCICDGKFNITLDEIEKIAEYEINNIFSEFEFDVDENLNQNLEIVKIDEKINRLINALSESENISIQYINNEIERLENLKNFIQNNKTKKCPYKLNFSELTFENKKFIAKELILKILVEENNIKFIWKI